MCAEFSETYPMKIKVEQYESRCSCLGLVTEFIIRPDVIDGRFFSL